MPNFDDIMNRSFGSGDTPYSQEEIDAALKRQKKLGGTLLENLRELTGRSMKTSFDLEKEIARLNENLKLDFNMNQEALLENAAYAGVLPASETETQDVTAAEAAYPTLKGADAFPSGSVKVSGSAEDFDDVTEKLSGRVFGQNEFIRKLVIAFKRPFVMPEKDGHARNSMYLTGPEDTGKHLALYELADMLFDKKLLTSREIRVIDLSLYANAGADNIFLQDLYTALRSMANILLFENFDACHISYLSYLTELVSTGKCRLSGRYVLQKGQLVNVSNSFASETVSSFSAAGKYLVFVSTKGVSKLADVLGAPFVNALGDICETKALDRESLGKISDVQWAALKEKAENQLGFRLETEEEAFRAFAVSRSERGNGLSGILRFYEELITALADMKLNGSYKRGTAVTLRTEGGRLYADTEGNTVDLFGLLPEGYQGELEAVREEMNNIVGLEKIKRYIFGLEEYYNVQKLRREEGLKTPEVSKHMIFTGNPGTGKTTIARIISRYLKAIGVLSGGQLVEVTRADLVGRYVGHTAPLTNQVLQSAIGGVLFIDGAYSLYRGQDDSFGLEAIDTLVKGIEDNRDNLIVILAGYSDEMAVFLTSNSGLKSRFPNVIEFPDYTGQELLDIAKITAKSKGYKIDEGALLPLLTYFNAVQLLRARTAGNGRLVRNKVEEAILNQSRRLVAEPDGDLSLLISADFDLSDVEG